MKKDHFIDFQKRSRFRLFLAAEAVFCLLVAVFAGLGSEALTSLVAFPLQPLALAMQKLSLSGEPGNTIAWAIYIVLSLLPAGIFVIIAALKKHAHADFLLLLLSAVLFYCYELLINPGRISTGMNIPDGVLEFACGTVTDLLLLLWIILRWSASAKKAETSDTTKALTVLVRLFQIIVIGQICYSTVSSLISSLQSMTTGNSVYSSFDGNLFYGLALGIDMTSWYLTITVLMIGAIVEMIPEIFALLILFGLEKLFLQMKEEPFSEAAVQLSKVLSRRCLNYLIIGIALEAAFDLLQLLLLNSLLSANFTITLPIIPLIILVIAWIFSGYIRRGKALQDDNDSFI